MRPRRRRKDSRGNQVSRARSVRLGKRVSRRGWGREQLTSGSRVVITGIGAVTPVGLDAATTWEALIAGVSGVGPIGLFDAAGYDARIAAEVKDFDPAVAMDRKEARHTDRFVQFALAASR
jgi:hypothetical protein